MSAPRATRRVRGVLLRLALSRPVALFGGVMLVIPAIVLATGDFSWEGWMTDGLGLVLGGTGAALVLTGVSGRRPDWIEDP